MKADDKNIELLKQLVFVSVWNILLKHLEIEIALKYVAVR